MKRRELIKAIVLALPLVASGCATEALLSKGGYQMYSEEIEAVLISQDLKNIVVFGDTHDYVFEDMEGLSNIINSTIHQYISGELSRFEIREGNEVRGTLRLVLDPGDTKVRDEAIALGFQQRTSGELYFYSAMTGRRYRKNPHVAVGETHQLNSRYSVNVSVPKGLNPAKLLLTPVALAADGALVLLGLPLVALFLVFRPKLF